MGTAHPSPCHDEPWTLIPARVVPATPPATHLNSRGVQIAGSVLHALIESVDKQDSAVHLRKDKTPGKGKHAKLLPPMESTVASQKKSTKRNTVSERQLSSKSKRVVTKVEEKRAPKKSSARDETEKSRKRRDSAAVLPRSSKSTKASKHSSRQKHDDYG